MALPLTLVLTLALAQAEPASADPAVDPSTSDVPAADSSSGDAPTVDPGMPPPDEKAVSINDRQYDDTISPWYLPRGVYLGTFIGYALTPSVRVQWELGFLAAKHDGLVFILEGGGGYGVNMPKTFGPLGTDPMTLMYEHTVTAGAGYRALYDNGVHWGFQITTGPVWYGARIKNAATENQVAGWIEGRVQLGKRLNNTVVGGVAVGYSSFYDVPRAYIQSGPYMGGGTVGIFLDWR